MESKLSNLYDALFKQQSIFTINDKGEQPMKDCSPLSFLLVNLQSYICCIKVYFIFIFWSSKSLRYILKMPSV